MLTMMLTSNLVYFSLMYKFIFKKKRRVSQKCHKLPPPLRLDAPLKVKKFNKRPVRFIEALRYFENTIIYSSIDHRIVPIDISFCKKLFN